MLATIFYIFGLILLLFYVIIISDLKKILYIVEFVEKFKKVTGKVPEKKDFKENTYDFYLFAVSTNILSFFWFFLGLISSNWLVFLLYFSIHPIISIFVRNVKVKLISNFFIILGLLINTFLVGLLVFNHFHLHLNLTSLILN